MMQASLQVAALDRRVEEERRRDGLGPLLQPWLEAATALRRGLAGARADPLRRGVPREQLDPIEQRLDHLQRRAAAFNVAADLDDCAASWGHLAHEIAALPFPQRDQLVRVVSERKDAIDRATAGLSRARAAGGVHPEQRARLRAAEDERERARERYARLRDDYLHAVRGRPAGSPSGAVAPAVVTLPELLAPRGLLRATSPRLDAVIERDRHLRLGVAQRFEKTLGSLATAGHRTLTDPRARELRGQPAPGLRHPQTHASLGRPQAFPGLQGLSGLSTLGEHGAIGRALAGQPAKESLHVRPRELHELIGRLKSAPRGSPLHQIALHAEDRRREIAARAKARLHGRGPAHPALRALGDAFHAHGRSDFAAHVAPGGALYHLLQGAQRSRGLPVPHLASHFLQSRGAHPLLGTVQLFAQLRAEGHRPHFGLFSRLKHAAGDAFHKATTAVAHTADDVARTAGPPPRRA